MSATEPAKPEKPIFPADVQRTALTELIEWYEIAVGLALKGLPRGREPERTMRLLCEKVEDATKTLCVAGFSFPTSWRVRYYGTSIDELSDLDRVLIKGIDVEGLDKAIREMKAALWTLEGKKPASPGGAASPGDAPAEGAPVTAPAAPAVKPAPVAPAVTVYQQIKAGPDRTVTYRELAKTVGKTPRVIQDWRENPRVLKAYPKLKRVSAQNACRGARVSLHKAADAFHAGGFLK